MDLNALTLKDLISIDVQKIQNLSRSQISIAVYFQLFEYLIFCSRALINKRALNIPLIITLSLVALMLFSYLKSSTKVGLILNIDTLMVESHRIYMIF